MESTQVQYVVLIKLTSNISHVITAFLQLLQKKAHFIDGAHACVCVSEGTGCLTYGWGRGWIVVSTIQVCMTWTHFKVFTMITESRLLWGPGTCFWQTLCAHRAAGTVSVNSSSQFMLDGLPSCVIDRYELEIQLQSTLTPTSKSNCRKLAYSDFYSHSVLERFLPSWEATAELCLSVSLMLWQIQHCMLFGLNPFPTSPQWQRSHALLCISYHYLWPGTCFFSVLECF